jgi:hypothetical protein
VDDCKSLVGDEREARGLSRSVTYSNVPLLVTPRHFSMDTPRGRFAFGFTLSALAGRAVRDRT